jgi:hypothetical protein
MSTNTVDPDGALMRAINRMWARKDMESLERASLVLRLIPRAPRPPWYRRLFYFIVGYQPPQMPAPRGQGERIMVKKLDESVYDQPLDGSDIPMGQKIVGGQWSRTRELCAIGDLNTLVSDVGPVPTYAEALELAVRLARALSFYATAEVQARKKVSFDDGMGDCGQELVYDHGDLARQALGRS